MTTEMFGWGAIILGVIMVVSGVKKWPQLWNYVWAAIVLLWGLLALI